MKRLSRKKQSTVFRVKNPIEEIRFQDLKNIEGKSEFWKECPHDGGTIGLERVYPNYFLSTKSYCFLCGQQFHFVDIVEDSFTLEFKI